MLMHFSEREKLCGFRTPPKAKNFFESQSKEIRDSSPQTKSKRCMLMNFSEREKLCGFGTPPKAKNFFGSHTSKVRDWSFVAQSSPSHINCVSLHLRSVTQKNSWLLEGSQNHLALLIQKSASTCNVSIWSVDPSHAIHATLCSFLWT